MSNIETAANSPQSPRTMRGAWYALGVLTVITLFAYTDRVILYLLAEQIKQRLGLSDFQLGLLQGTAVALFAALASYPLGWLSDRYDRRVVMAGCVLFWSLAVVGCGLAQTFEQLLVAAALVGAGEAGLVPIVYSMIPDLFPAHRRQLANSVFAIAAMSVGGLAFLIGGQVIGAMEPLRAVTPVLQAIEPWRLAFFAAALPAPLMVALIASLRLSRRTAGPGANALGHAAGPPPHGSVAAHVSLPILPYLREHAATIVPFLFGIGIATLGFGATGAWMVVILTRLYGQTAAQVGAAVTPITLLSTAAGFAVSVWGARAFAARWGERLPIRVLIVAYVITALGNLAIGATRTALQFYILSGLVAIITSTANMLYPTAIQSLVPSHLRGRLVSIQATMFFVIGAAAAPLVGLLSDHMSNVPRAIQVASISVSVPAMLIAAALLIVSERGYLRTVADARRLDAESTPVTLAPATP